MPTRYLNLDSANALLPAIGPAHGLSAEEIARATPATKQVIARLEREHRTGQHRFRDLPHDRPMRQLVQAAVRRHAGRFDNLVVLGIGGSALGNIALQTALNPANAAGRAYM